MWVLFSSKAGKVIPKRKQWSAEQRGPKRVKVEVKATQTEETQCLTDGMSSEAYELMVKGKHDFIVPILINWKLKILVHLNLELPVFVETPPSTYWNEVADERRKALYSVLQENEKVS